MAEFLWTFAVQEVLRKMVKLAAEQIGLAWGLEKELSKLRKWLLKAETIIGDINSKKLHHDSVRLWVKDLQHILHEAEDLLDELVYENLRRKVEIGKTKVRYSISPTHNHFLFRRKMAKKMKDITETLYKHYCEASPLGLVGLESTETNHQMVLKQIRETTSNLNFEVVGREIEVSKIVKHVIDSNNEHDMSIIPIVGMGGLGKTTLAKMIFKHEVIQRHFDQTIWVCVSEPFIVINILEGIFESLMNASSGLNYKETLLQRLQKEMQGKKYFLVLDDVWNEESGLWHDLRECLKQIAGKSGNSIIVTTRSVKVATIMETVPSHHLRKLSHDHCWSLFKESANANGLPMNPKLEDIREVLVKKIGGVPLVAKVLGGAIRFEEDYEGWMTKVESIVKNISKDDKDFVLSILKLSVDCLPLLSLKQCFAYCSNFPKDCVFDKENLIRMWVAQGFIQPQEGDNEMLMEDIGEWYFNFLLSRSLFQDIVKNMNGSVTHFKMHDLMHDIACAISNHQKWELDSSNWTRKSARKLRTLICNNQAIYDELANCACVRVLVLDFVMTNNLLDSVGKLKHLRYLDMSKCSVRVLPESIAMLYNLQTLKLGSVESLPKNLRNMVSLRHLDFYHGCYHTAKQMPSHMSELIHLQTLYGFVAGFEKGCKIEELGPLKNLKGKLRLSNLERVKSREEAIAAKLVEKKNLCELVFDWSLEFGRTGINCNDLEVLKGLQPHKNLQSLNIMYFGGQLLPNAVFVENLVVIRLYGCKKCEMLPTLGNLPNLEELELSFMDSVRSIGSEFYGNDSNQRDFFPKLKKLEFGVLHNLELWKEVAVESNLFRSLQTLNIYGCNKLTKFPKGLECCNSINVLMISGCPNLVLNVQNMHNLFNLCIDGLKKLPEDLARLAHLREIAISGCIQDYDFSPLIHLPSLTNIRLTGGLRNATQLPQQLEQLTILKALRITNFNGIEVLPEWLGNLRSLEMLVLDNCNNLKELPSREAMLRLTKLNHLKVRGCPLLLLGQGNSEGTKLSHLPTNCIYVYIIS